MKQEIYAEQYKFEWEHRAYLLSAINLAIVLATVVGGALMTIARLYRFSSSPASYSAAAFLTLAFGALAFAVYSIYRAVSGYEYARAPMPSALRQWSKEIADWHKRFGTISQVDNDVEEGFLKRLGEAIEVNWANNKLRSIRIYRANIATAVAATLLIVPSGLFVIQDKTTEPRPHPVEIIGGKLQILGDEDNGE